MFKKLSLIGSAVAAALVAAPSMAAVPNINEQTTGVVVLTIAGSSAFQAAFESELGLNGATCAATADKFSATVTNGTAPGLFAYTCTSKVGGPFGATQKPLIIYYRTEGGSIYGITPTVRASSTPLRLQLTSSSNCAASSGTTTCAVGTQYDAVSDTLSGTPTNVTTSNTDLGLSDVEPAMFIGSNYPDATVYAKVAGALTTAELNTLNSHKSILALQSFTVATHNESGGTGADAEFNAVGGLSKAVLAEVLKGTFNDWNQVPKADGSNTTVTSSSLPIVLCRREPGSGTQVSASIFFHKTGCKGGTDVFASGANPGNLNTVNQLTTTGNMQTCIATNKGAIGFYSTGANATGRAALAIDGKSALDGASGKSVPTASGSYGFAYEMVALTRAGLTGDPSTLAGKLITTLQDYSKGPSTLNISFLPTGPNAAHAGFPLDLTGKAPISCFSRSGSSCNDLADTGC